MLVKYLSSDREETEEEASQCQKNIRSKQIQIHNCINMSVCVFVWMCVCVQCNAIVK